MSKHANAGELRTPVYFKSVTRATGNNGYKTDTEKNVFGDGNAVNCKWVNVHGTEVLTAMELEVKEPATLTMRYSPLIVPTLIVYREADEEPYEIISVDDVEQKHIWLEVKVKRRTPAR